MACTEPATTPSPLAQSIASQIDPLAHSRKLGIAEAALVMIAILAESPSDQAELVDGCITMNTQTLREIAALARKALIKTSHSSVGA